jgi:hypothetical protein
MAPRRCWPRRDQAINEAAAAGAQMEPLKVSQESMLPDL